MSREERIFATIDLLRRNQVLTQMLDEAASDYLGINPIDGRAIDVIDQHGRITAGELARELRLSSGAVTALLDRLERAGLARRVPDDHDRRRVLIEVTPLIHDLARQIYGAPEDAVAWASVFSDEELDVLYRYQQLSQKWLEERLERVASLPPPQPRAAAGETRSARPRPGPS
jgi:DNA-binding MarR family transcriptional regulator